jgi:hypothetical protein
MKIADIEVGRDENSSWHQHLVMAGVGGTGEFYIGIVEDVSALIRRMDEGNMMVNLKKACRVNNLAQHMMQGEGRVGIQIITTASGIFDMTGTEKSLLESMRVSANVVYLARELSPAHSHALVELYLSVWQPPLIERPNMIKGPRG